MMRVLVGTAVLAVVLAGCSDGDEPPEPTATPVPTAVETTAPEVPDDVSTTSPGTTLAFGEDATLAWRPSSSTTGVVEARVTKVSERGSRVLEAFLLDEANQGATPYFVEVTLTNVGDTDLGGQQVPLYVRDDQGKLDSPWTVGEDFERCRSGPLPEEFAAGESVDMCLLYLVPAPGAAEDVVFQPTQDFEPVSWTGQISTPRR